MANRISVPDNTEALHAIGEYVMQYEAMQNAYLTALVNRIGMTIITSKMWDNPWSVFKKGRLEFGETVEEIFVNLAKPHSFDPATAEKEVYKREIPDVRAAFHSMDFQKFYKVTISNDQLRQSFLSWNGITELIAKIVDSLYTGMRYDEYVTMKYMICREMLNGGFYNEETAALTKDTASDVMTSVRGLVGQLDFMSSKYNRSGVMTHTPREDLYVIISAANRALIDVDVLAVAFNMDKTDFLGHLIEVDSFDEHDELRLTELFGDDENFKVFTDTEKTALGAVIAAMVDKDWWMVFDVFDTFTQNYNGQGLYWQYFYHVWRIFSASPFANAICVSSNASTVTAVAVTPAEANVTQGANLQMTAAVTGTGLYDKQITWAASGQVSSETNIDPMSGVLHVGKDETAGSEITVTATAVNGTEGTATITVVQA
ncbi:MAG: hypothetical protein DBX59_10120 [Bacillota bacterium]|nr:MAG: hypothetical protein DBX59_10120 [Bacillota bacterium]